MAALLLTGCASSKQWSFSLSRSVYGSLEPVGPRHADEYEDYDDHGRQGEALGYILFLAAPIAIDLLLLPITAPRDLIVMARWL